MLLIYCPHCQESRAEEEFEYAGEAHRRRPADPDACTDQQWGEYLYARANPRGRHHEMWYHAAGCRRFINVVRDTASYRVESSAMMVQSPAGGAGQ